MAADKVKVYVPSSTCIKIDGHWRSFVGEVEVGRLIANELLSTAGAVLVEDREVIERKAEDKRRAPAPVKKA